MSTEPTPWPATATHPSQAVAAAPGLWQETLEQVMRLVEDDLAVLPFLAAAPASPAAALALGKLMAAHPVRLVDRCPLVAFVTGRPVDPRWRTWYPPAERSLWSTLTFLAELYGPPDMSDPYLALETLRARGDQDLPRGSEFGRD